MCEHHEQLQKAAHELEAMHGNGIWDYPRLKKLLNQALDHNGGHE